MRIGIDIGGMSVKYGLVDDRNNIVTRHVIDTNTEISAPEFIKEIGQQLHVLLEGTSYTMADISSIGIGCPGAIDSKKGLVVHASNLGWDQVDLVAQMTEMFQVPIGLANDADTAALGEAKAGAAKGASDVVLITLGTGVGGGVIINSSIFSGPLNGGCELGHMIIHADGYPCNCGKNGCFESYASATALMRMGREAAMANPNSMLWKVVDGRFDEITGKTIFDCKEAGDEQASQVVDTYLNYLSIGIGNIVNIFRPEKIIIGGGVSAQKEKLTNEIENRLNNLVFAPNACETAKVVTSVLGNDAGIIGAANLI